MQCARERGDFVLEGDMGMLNKKLQQRLGKKLRKIFSDVATEPLPPRLAALLDPDDPPPFGGASGARRVRIEKCEVDAISAWRKSRAASR